MRVMTILGSYRRKGNTAHILELIEVDLRARGATVDRLNLGETELLPCRGCRICFDLGELRCPRDDALLDIHARMQAADLLIVATPVYVNDVSGLVKTWIDRLAFVCHRPEFAGRSAYLLATVGVGPTAHTLRTLNLALRSWGYHLVGQRGFTMGALMKKGDAEAAFRQEAARIAAQCAQAVTARHALNPDFLSLMTFRIQQLAWVREADDSLDYVYWSEQGWLDPRCTFYMPHRAGWIKTRLARLAGTLLAPFVS